MNMNFKTNVVTDESRIEALRSSGNGSDFARSLISQFEKKGSLSAKQWHWVDKLASEKKPQRDRHGLSNINFANGVLQLMAEAQGSGLKRPRLTVGTHRFSVAPLDGKNAGYVYVTTQGGTYLGKVSRDGRYFPAPVLQKFEADELMRISQLSLEELKQEMVLQGKRSSHCCFCSTTITTNESLAVGYGPVCADRFGLPWGGA